MSQTFPRWRAWLQDRHRVRRRPGCDPPPQRAIPAFHEGRLDRRAELPETQLLDKATRPTEDHAPADLHDMASRGADLDDLGVEQVLGGDEPRTRLPPHLPPPSTTIDDAQHLEQRRARGFPASSEKKGDLPHAGDDLGHQCGGLLLRARSDVDPEPKPAAHCHGGVDPRHLAWAQFGMGFVHLDAGHVHLAHHLAMVGLSALGSDVLKAMHRFEIRRTNIGGPLVTDAPPLTFDQPSDRVFGKLAMGHQGARPFGELLVACRAAQSFDVFVRAWPRSVHDVPGTGTIKARTRWIWTRKASLSLLRWCR